MQVRYVTLLLVLWSLQAIGQTQPDCDGNTLEITECMQSESDRIEAQLNEVYGRVMKSLSHADAAGVSYSAVKMKLRDAQRAWVTYREKDCDAVYTLDSGGSIRNISFLSCMLSHAKTRIKELEEQYLSES